MLITFSSRKVLSSSHLICVAAIEEATTLVPRKINYLSSHLWNREFNKQKCLNVVLWMMMGIGATNVRSLKQRCAIRILRKQYWNRVTISLIGGLSARKVHFFLEVVHYMLCVLISTVCHCEKINHFLHSAFQSFTVSPTIPFFPDCLFPDGHIRVYRAIFGASTRSETDQRFFNLHTWEFPLQWVPAWVHTLKY